MVSEVGHSSIDLRAVTLVLARWSWALFRPINLSLATCFVVESPVNRASNSLSLVGLFSDDASCWLAGALAGEICPLGWGSTLGVGGKRTTTPSRDICQVVMGRGWRGWIVGPGCTMGGGGGGGGAMGGGGGGGGPAGSLPLRSTSIAAWYCCCGVRCRTELLGPGDRAAPCVIPWPSSSDSSSSSGAGETTLCDEVCCLVGSGRSWDWARGERWEGPGRLKGWVGEAELLASSWGLGVLDLTRVREPSLWGRAWLGRKGLLLLGGVLSFMTQLHGEITYLVLEVIIFIRTYRNLSYCICVSLDILLHTIINFMRYLTHSVFDFINFRL